MKQFTVKFKYTDNRDIIDKQKTVTAENEVEAIEQVQDEEIKHWLDNGYEVTNVGDILGIYTKDYEFIARYHNFEAMEVVNNV
jgi:hypothetical protein